MSLWAAALLVSKSCIPKKTWSNLREAFLNIELVSPLIKTAVLSALPVKKLNVHIKGGVTIQIAKKVLGELRML